MNQDNNQNIEQQPIQPEQPVNNEQPISSESVEQNPVVPKEGVAKSSIVIIILLLLIIGVESWYIYSTKFKDNNTSNEPETPTITITKNLLPFDKNQVTVKSNVTEDGKDYYEVYTIKNSDLTVELKLFTEKPKDGREIEEGYDDTLKMDLYINGNKKDEIILDSYFRCAAQGCEDEESFSSYPFEEVKRMWDGKIASAIGTIEGDKNYLYLLFTRKNSSLYIINELGEIIDTEGLKFYTDEHQFGGIKVSESCKTYEYAKDLDDIQEHFIKKDAIYYVLLSKYENEKEYANEYKVTFSGNKMNKEKIGTCEVQAEGEKPEKEDYEDM